MVHKSVATLADNPHLTIAVDVAVVQIQQTLTNQCLSMLVAVVDHQDQPPVELLLRISPFDCQIFVAPSVALVRNFVLLIVQELMLLVHPILLFVFLLFHFQMQTLHQLLLCFLLVQTVFLHLQQPRLQKDS